MMSTKDVVRFGLFELDLDARQLHKNGIRIGLSQQSFQLLVILLERPGQVFTREELRQRLWPSDVFIDFDHGLNRSIQKLREALGDSADSCRYIETQQRVGYRFIAPVRTTVAPLPDPEASPPVKVNVEEPAVETALAGVSTQPPQRRHPLMVSSLSTAILFIVVATGWFLWRHRQPAPKPISSLAALPLENLSGNPNQKPAAREAYLRGRYFLSKREAGKSTEYFEQAVALDPSSASAYAGLSDSLESEILLGMARPEDAMPRALVAAKRAIALDPQNGEAYAALGGIETTYEWNWAAAEHNLTRGIALSPTYSYGEMRYAVFLDAMNRPNEAIAHMRRALQLDPLSFLMNRHMGSTLFFARHYDEALYHLRRAGEMEPQSTVVENWVSWIYEKKGMRDEAVSHDLALLRRDLPQDEVDRLRTLYQRAGWKGYWQRRIDLMSPDEQQGCTAYSVALSYLRLGNQDQAFLSLNRAIDHRCVWMIWLKVDPMLDDLRPDPRYAKLLRRINLPE
jgi:DNA-binding winged helix-turn-helix (wHTH) protein/tetratricopeptide (TPR) repeat protein